MFLFRNSLSAFLFKNRSSQEEILWLSGIIVAEATILITSSVLRAEQKANIYLRNTTIKYAIFFISNLLLLKYTTLRIKAAFISYVLCNLVYFLLSLSVWRSNTRTSFSPSVLKTLMKYGTPLMPNVLLAILLFRADHYFLQHYHNLGIVGKYAFGYKFGSALFYIIAALNNAWYPHLFRLSKDELPRVFNRVLFWVTFSSVSAFLCIDFGFRFFHAYFLPRAYWASLPIISWVGLSYILHNVANFTDSLFYYNKKVVYVLLISAAGAALNILLNILLIPKYVMTGAVIATFSSFALCLILVLVFLRKISPVRIQWPGMSKVTLSFIVIYVTSHLIKPEPLSGKIALFFGLILGFFFMTISLNSQMRRECKTFLGGLQKRKEMQKEK